MKRVDARGLACPQPVILAKKAIDESDEVLILVSEESSAENVADMARSARYAVETTKADGHFTVSIKRQSPATTVSGQEVVGVRPGSASSEGTVWVVGSDAIGNGDDELGRVLRKAFVGALAESSAPPAKLLFINAGVKLVADGSPVLEPLEKLAASGVAILACGTCLDYYALKDKVAVGSVSNMYNFIELLMGAEKVITF